MAVGQAEAGCFLFQDMARLETHDSFWVYVSLKFFKVSKTDKFSDWKTKFFGKNDVVPPLYVTFFKMSARLKH